jgi:N-methylhydantoinase A
VTTERGLDARDFALVAYGGAGPLHACMVAEELQISTIIIPNAPGHFSAYGMLVADLRRDYVQTLFSQLEAMPFEQFDRILFESERQGIKDIRLAAGRDVTITATYALDMRYVGQEHAVPVNIPRGLFAARDVAGIKAHFDQVHKLRYGYASAKEGAEIVSVRCSFSGEMPKPSFDRITKGDDQASASVLIEQRPVYFPSTGFTETPVYARAGLLAGNKFAGPCLIEEHATTTVIPPATHVIVDPFGNLLIKRQVDRPLRDTAADRGQPLATLV